MRQGRSVNMKLFQTAAAPTFDFPGLEGGIQCLTKGKISLEGHLEISTLSICIM